MEKSLAHGPAKPAAIGRQSDGHSFGRRMVQDIKKIRVEGGFAHDMEGHLLGHAVPPDLADRPAGQVRIHIAPWPGHEGLRTEETVEIADVGEFYMDPFKGNLHMSEVPVLHAANHLIPPFFWVGLFRLSHTDEIIGLSKTPL